ncbi:hypothetical protein GCM10027521_16690 [Amycolatopsis cihanbeyliensis]
MLLHHEEVIGAGRRIVTIGHRFGSATRVPLAPVLTQAGHGNALRGVPAKPQFVVFPAANLPPQPANVGKIP